MKIGSQCVHMGGGDVNNIKTDEGKYPKKVKKITHTTLVHG